MQIILFSTLSTTLAFLVSGLPLSKALFLVPIVAFSSFLNNHFFNLQRKL